MEGHDFKGCGRSPGSYQGHDFSRAVRVLMRTAYFGLGFVEGHDFSRTINAALAAEGGLSGEHVGGHDFSRAVSADS